MTMARNGDGLDGERLGALGRRSVLGGIIAAACAPSIVRASSLMPIKSDITWLAPGRIKLTPSMRRLFDDASHGRCFYTSAVAIRLNDYEPIPNMLWTILPAVSGMKHTTEQFVWYDGRLTEIRDGNVSLLQTIPKGHKALTNPEHPHA